MCNCWSKPGEAAPTPAIPEPSPEVVKLVEAYKWSIVIFASGRGDTAQLSEEMYATRAALLAEFSRLQALSAYRPQVQAVAGCDAKWLVDRCDEGRRGPFHRTADALNLIRSQALASIAEVARMKAKTTKADAITSPEGGE